MSNVLLIQADGTLPNLALMKIARYHSNLKDNIFLEHGITISQKLFDYDKVYISCIFNRNKENVMKLMQQFPKSEVVVGGSGIDVTSCLPDEIECLMPYYSLFNCGYSVGFTSRGCIRKCPFCIVPKKEGSIKQVTDIYNFWCKYHKHLVLLDNNILALPDHFKNICNQIVGEKLTVDFNQGLDIRLLDENNIKLLRSLKIKPCLRFSWDNINDEGYIVDGINLLDKYGIKNTLFYVLVGYDNNFSNDIYKLNKLKSLNKRAYCMRIDAVRGDRRYNDLAAWTNQQQFFMKMDFESFRSKRHDRN